MHDNRANSPGFGEIIILPLIVVILLFIIWITSGAKLLAIMFSASYWAFPWFAKIPSMLLPDGTREQFLMIGAELATAKPGMFGWETMRQLLQLWGYALRIVLIPALVIIGIMGLRLPPNYKYRRQLDLSKLAEQNSELFPCIKPVLGKELHKADLFTGPWRIAESPIEFSATRGLLQYKGRELPPAGTAFLRMGVKKKRKHLKHHSYMSLNKEAADRIFRQQLGKPWRGVDALDPLIKGLVIALMSMVAGGDYRRKGADLLDQISATFVEADPNEGRPARADLRGADDLLSEVKALTGVQEAIEGHAFESTVIMSLLLSARDRAGKVPPSSFIWLRPTDRTLWYSLHPISGRNPQGKPWAEGAAAWAHFYAELDLGRSISTPVIEGATDGLEMELFNEQWIHSDKLHLDKQNEDSELMAALEKVTNIPPEGSRTPKGANRFMVAQSK